MSAPAKQVATPHKSACLGLNCGPTSIVSMLTMLNYTVQFIIYTQFNIYTHRQDELRRRCLKGGRAYNTIGEHCLGGDHGNQANANHPKNSSDPSVWMPEGP